MNFRTSLPTHDVETLVPALSGMGRATMRLHPHPVSEVDPASSHIGGPLLWPEQEEWPRARARQHPLTRFEGGAMVGDQTQNDFLVPLIQVRSDDVGREYFPPGQDLLQVLWTPRLVQSAPGIEFEVYWRSQESGLVVLQPPSPSAPDPTMVPRACSLHPEEVREYPAELPAGTGVELEDLADSFGDADRYFLELAVAPGLKMGGYPDLPSIAPIGAIECAQGHECDLLLSIDGAEWNSVGETRWRAQAPGQVAQERCPTGLVVGRDQRLAIFVCRRCDGYPTIGVLG